jgi:hypothetical protein
MADNGEEKIVYKLDLDAEAFMKTLNSVNDRLGAIEKSAKTTEIASMFELGTIAIEGFKYAAELAGKVLDVVFDGEKITRVNAQFDMLSKNLGISSNEFKENIEKATGGLVSETEALESANRAMLAMGSSSERFTEIITIARKATAAFGGDFKANLEEITRTISVGNVRALKTQYGIIVDADQALRKYAASVGLSVNVLTEQEKKQALANAAIDAANKKFKDISASSDSTKSAFLQFKTALTELQEAAEVFFSKLVGPTFKNIMKDWSAELKTLRENIQATFSDDNGTKAKALAGRIDEVTDRLERMKNGPKEAFSAPEYEALKKKLVDYRQELSLIQEEQRKIESQKSASGEKPLEKPEEQHGDPRKILEEKTKFETELLAMKEAANSAQMAVETNQQRNIELIREQYENLEQKRELEKQKVDEQFRGQELTKHEEIAELKKQIDAKYIADVQAMEDDYYNRRIRALENQVKHSQNAFDRISAQNKLAFANMQKDGGASFHALSGATDSFKKTFKKEMTDIVAGHKSASDIMKTIFFNMLGEMADQYGEFYLAKYVASDFTDFGALAGSGAFFALGGVLSSLGGGNSGGGGSASGGGGGSGSGAPGDLGATPTGAAVAAPQKGVTIQVQGSYFDTEQTRQRLTEMIRNETDATDFKYVQIGKN